MHDRAASAPTPGSSHATAGRGHGNSNLSVGPSPAYPPSRAQQNRMMRAAGGNQTGPAPYTAASAAPMTTQERAQLLGTGMVPSALSFSTPIPTPKNQLTNEYMQCLDSVAHPARATIASGSDSFGEWIAGHQRPAAAAQTPLQQTQRLLLADTESQLDTLGEQADNLDLPQRLLLLQQIQAVNDMKTKLDRPVRLGPKRKVVDVECAVKYDPNDNTAEHLLLFLDGMQQAIERNRMEDDEDMIALLHKSLDRRTLTWALNYTLPDGDGRRKPTYSELHTALMHRHNRQVPGGMQDALEEAWHHMTMAADETYLAFHERVHELAVRMGKGSENVLSRFRKGLDPASRYALAHIGTELSMDQIVTRLTHMRQAKQSLDIQIRGDAVSSAAARTVNLVTGAPAAASAPATPTIALIGGPSGKCYGCGEEGHERRACPNQNRPANKPDVQCYQCQQWGHYANRCPESQLAYGNDNTSHRRTGRDNRPAWQTSGQQQQPPAVQLILGGQPAAVAAPPAQGSDQMLSQLTALTSAVAAAVSANASGARNPVTTGVTCQYCGEPHSQLQCPKMARTDCWRCGELGHMMQACPRYLELSRVACDICHDRGHLPKACRGRPDRNRGSAGRGRGRRNDRSGNGGGRGGYGGRSRSSGPVISLVSLDEAEAQARDQTAEFLQSQQQPDFHGRN